MSEIRLFNSNLFRFYRDVGEAIDASNLPIAIQEAITTIFTYASGLKTEEEIKLSTAYAFIKANATDEEKLTMLAVFPIWQGNTAYAIGDEVVWNDELYRVVQQHLSQSSWTPGTTPALYTKIAPPGVIPDWVQPTGAQDAYNIGDRVMFEGSVYESVINANTWSPTAYPAGWLLIP